MVKTAALANAVKEAPSFIALTQRSGEMPASRAPQRWTED
jgi:hypothetical protein